MPLVLITVSSMFSMDIPVKKAHNILIRTMLPWNYLIASQGLMRRVGLANAFLPLQRRGGYQICTLKLSTTLLFGFFFSFFRNYHYNFFSDVELLCGSFEYFLVYFFTCIYDIVSYLTCSLLFRFLIICI